MAAIRASHNAALLRCPDQVRAKRSIAEIESAYAAAMAAKRSRIESTTTQPQPQEKTMKTYTIRSNAIRAARAELGIDAKEGVDFRVVNADDGRHGFEVINKASEPAPMVEDKPAAGSPGPALLAEVINKPFVDHAAAKEASPDTAVDVALANAHLDGIQAFLQREEPTGEELAAHQEKIAQFKKAASPERELIVRKTPTPAPKAERSGTKIAAVLEKAKTTGITMAQVREMTGWSKTGGFYGAIKRAGLKLTKDASGVYHAA